MRFKTYPYYNAWSDVFGKDRATGEFATTFTDAVNEVLLIGEGDPNDGIHSGFEGSSRTSAKGRRINFDEDDEDAMSFGTPNVGKGKSKQSVGHPNPSARIKTAKYDATSSLISEISQMMGKFLEAYKDVAGTLAMNMGEGFCDRNVEKSGKVFEIVGVMEFITETQRFNIATKLTTDTKKKDLFLSMPSVSQTTYATLMSEDKL